MSGATGATLFSGFEGVGCGMKAAGITPLWGIEWRDDVAQVARNNGFHSITSDILTVDPHTMERVDFLHASPPCTNASVANSKAGESEHDKALAYKTAQFVEVLRPEVFTLENVWQYRKFESFKFILTTLERLGYWIDVQNVNAADFGVPQTRKRMILRARLGGWIPNMPDPVRWVGWYEAIKDLIPTLPESRFAEWQLKRLPDELRTMLVNSAFPTSNGKKHFETEEPAYTVDTQAISRMNAFLIGNGNRSSAVDRHDPSETITANHNQATTRAFLANINMSGDNGEAVQTNDAGEPAFTVTQSADGRLRAFLVDGKLSTSGDEKRLQIMDTQQPSATVVSSNSVMKDQRACTAGRVVSMTPRALARFQSIPDWYELPAKKSLACYGIGNAVPPLMMEKIYGQLV